MVSETVDDYAKLRDEMAQQFKELKDSFEASNKEKDEIIAQLREQNQGLQRALVRSAMTEPPVQEKEPTPEERYYAERDRLVQLTKERMRGMM